ncbi:hypothetical protein SAMN05216352_109113 [Alteribacillus bidgolensis]|uniref:Uncharacterized protein n=1 Tax=Alteribacillus bidgolensis TaxID=930129 RepID=A0A1G8LWT6_9BACI|nr:hypothetical protein SAMN05216352_109113 [Alteribacillus bidgolensis]
MIGLREERVLPQLSLNKQSLPLLQKRLHRVITQELVLESVFFAKVS